MWNTWLLTFSPNRHSPSHNTIPNFPAYRQVVSSMHKLASSLTVWLIFAATAYVKQLLIKVCILAKAMPQLMYKMYYSRDEHKQSPYFPEQFSSIPSLGFVNIAIKWSHYICYTMNYRTVVLVCKSGTERLFNVRIKNWFEMTVLDVWHQAD